MLSRTRTSANIYSRNTGLHIAGALSFSRSLIPKLVLPPLFLSVSTLMLLASCSGGRYVAVPDGALQNGEVRHETRLAHRPPERPAERPEKGAVEKQKPLTEFGGERKRVTASWYGPDFHGKLTASGEVYNMYNNTCAHKEYPFGTRLRVVSVLNDKDVECLVNDRGPFVPGRDLDLSYAAAKKIDMIGTGTAPVTIEPVGRDMRYVKYIREGGATDGLLTIQVASFREESNARRLKMALELNHGNVYIMEANVGGAHYYRVRVGKFSSRGDAYKTGGPIANEGYEVLITKYEQGI